jgi:uncharacterized membrane protein YcaP (DUF421 family)
MEIWDDIFGQGKDLNSLQMSLRAIIISVVTLLLIRISGRRSFGMKLPFDNVTVILLGAILSRAIVGVSPMIPTIAAALTIVLMHRGFAWLSLKNKWLSRIAKGKKIVLYQNDKLQEVNMTKALVSEEDLKENIRVKIQQEGFQEIEQAFMERSGEISFIKKK